MYCLNALQINITINTMKPILLLKLLWRKILIFQEAKKAFFHANERLINDKKYDRLFRSSFYAGTEFLYYMSEKDLIYLKTKNNVTIVTNKNYGVFLEIFAEKIYSLPIQMQNEFYVFDVGMNRGYSSLFYADMDKCQKVFGFEPDKGNYNWALANCELNPFLKDKIITYNYGLWDKDDEMEMQSCDSDYMNALSVLVEEYDEVKKIKKRENQKQNIVSVKKASSTLLPIIKQLPEGKDKILKIDIEGAEYTVFKDMFDGGVLQCFDLIIGECHNGISGLEPYLNDFSCLYKSKESGNLLSFCYINKRKTES